MAFNKILVAEDLGTTNHGIIDILRKKLEDSSIKQALYCDDALLQVLRSKKDNAPFDLLVTDLSFTQDHRPRKISTGEELIIKVREVLPDIKILVFSIENRPSKIKSLFIDYAINGYICKGRDGLKELNSAVGDIYKGVNYVSKALERALKSAAVFELGDFDVLLLKRLSEGYLQEEISSQFKREGKSPNSRSTIEKRLNKLKIEFRAKNTTQLIAIVKDLGLI